MIKRVLIAAGSLLLAVVIVLLVPVSTAGPDMSFRPAPPSTTGSTPAASTTGTTAPPPTANTVTTVPSTSAEPSTAPTTAPTEPPTTAPTAPPRPGQVRLYTCDPVLFEIYAQMAVEYYQATGIEVILQTPAEGEDCATALSRYMASVVAPTVFCIHEEAALRQYADWLYDLRGTSVAGKLYSADFGMYSGEKLLALPVEVDWFGYIYNTALLGEVSFTRKDFFRPDMTSYNSMAYIAKYITSQKNTLGAYAFGQPALGAAAQGSLSDLLSTVFRDPEQLRSFIDLYVGNSRSTTDALTAFQSGKIVFCTGTTASFDKALTLGIDKLELLPVFSSGGSAMHYTCDHFWAVTGTGYAPDIQETLVFLNWMVTATEDAPAPIDRLNLLSPYKDATVAHNALEKHLRGYMTEEPACLVWNSSCVKEEEMAAFCAALTAYYQKPNDTTWAAVEVFLKKKNE